MIELINFYVDQDTDADRAAVNDAIDSGVWP